MPNNLHLVWIKYRTYVLRYIFNSDNFLYFVVTEKKNTY